MTNTDSRCVHLITSDVAPTGYGYACRIQTKLTDEQAQEIYGARSMGSVNCDWCKLAKEAEEEAEKDKRVTTVTFDIEAFERNVAQSRAESQRLLEEYRHLSEKLDRALQGRSFSRPMSAHDFEQAINFGVKQAVSELLYVDKFREDLIKIHEEAEARLDEEYNTDEAIADRKEDRKSELREVFQEPWFRDYIKHLHKEAEDEIDAEFDEEQYDTDRKEQIKAAVREVLEEVDVRQSQPVNQTISIEASVEPESFKEMVKQASKDAQHEMEVEDDESDKAYWVKLINGILDEREAKKREETAALHAEAMRRFEEGMGLPPRIMFGDTSGSVLDTVIRLPEPEVRHYKRFLDRETACGVSNPIDCSRLAVLRRSVTCKDCLFALGVAVPDKVVHLRKVYTENTPVCGRVVPNDEEVYDRLDDPDRWDKVTCVFCKERKTVTGHQRTN